MDNEEPLYLATAELLDWSKGDTDEIYAFKVVRASRYDALAARNATLEQMALMPGMKTNLALQDRVAALEAALNEVTETRQRELAYVQKAVMAAIKDRANVRVELDDLLEWAANRATAFPFPGLPAETGVQSMTPDEQAQYGRFASKRELPVNQQEVVNQCEINLNYALDEWKEAGGSVNPVTTAIGCLVIQMIELQSSTAKIGGNHD